MKTKNLLLTLAMVFIAFFSGCAEDDFVETVGVCPVVISTIPANGALGVPFNQIISATFNEAMNPSTINASTFIIKKADGTAVTGTVTYSGTTATFTPASRLSPNTTYTGRITTGSKDVDGNALQTDYVWTFSTGMIIVPVVISTDPTSNEINVALNKTITATFSVPMDPSTIDNSTFIVKQGTNTIAGAITYTGSTVSFKPTSPFNLNTVYTVTITTGAKSLLQGTPLATNYIWSFVTVAAPTVISTDPFTDQTGVNLNKTVTATFSRAMDPSTIISPATTFTVRQGTTVIAGVVTYSGTTASFNPVNPLDAGRTYTATITTAAKDLAGISMANDYVWSFTTGVTTPIPAGSTLGVFGGSAGITNQGLFTRINGGSISTTAAATLVTGFHDVPNNIDYTVTPLNRGLANGGIIVGTAANPDYNTALALYNSISPASKPGGAVLSTGDLGGQILAPGTYTSASTINITSGDLTLNGNASDVWIFQAGSSLTVGGVAPVSVKLTGGALAKNVFWYVKETAVINYAGGGVMVGTIAATSGITLSNPANSTNAAVTTLNGKAISIVASVTMVNTVINIQ